MQREHLVSGELFTVRLHWRADQPGDVRGDVVLSVGEFPVGRGQLSLESVQIGGIYLQDFEVRLPYSCSQGDYRPHASGSSGPLRHSHSQHFGAGHCRIASASEPRPSDSHPMHSKQKQRIVVALVGTSPGSRRLRCSLFERRPWVDSAGKRLMECLRRRGQDV